MKSIIKLLLTIITTLVMIQSYGQAAIYVFHDEAYMDKYQYKVENLSAYDYHIAYHIYTSTTEKVILNISMSSYGDVDATQLKATLPITKMNWNTTLINEINSQSKLVHLVFKEDEIYKSYQVSSAIYVQETAESLMYSGPYYSYTFNKNKSYDPAVDLEGGKFEMYDEAIFMTSTEAEDKNCMRQFGFIKIIRETHPKNSFTMVANSDFTKLQTNQIYETCQTALYVDYVENIGITEERTKNGKISLVGINNQGIDNYIAQRCEIPDTYSTLAKPADTESIQPTGKPGLNFNTRTDNTEKSGTATPATTSKTKPTTVPIVNTNNTTTKSEDDYELIYDMIGTITQPKPSLVASKPEVNTKGNARTHIVDNGETLYSISRKYNISVKSLQELNNLEDTAIFVTQELVLPSSEN